MILLDSNIAIYAAQSPYQKLREWLREQTLIVSDLTKLEVLGYHRISNTELDYFSRFFSSIDVIPISNDIIETAIPVRRVNKMSLGDSIIAASVLMHNLELCTNNEKDFENVENLRMIKMKNI